MHGPYSYFSVNKKLLPMKLHYFLYSGCIATILNFGSTYAKQLGYTKITVGYVMMCLFILSMLAKPLVGAVVDKFHGKKYLFLVFICTTGVSAYFFMFVPRLPLETSVRLYCDGESTTVKLSYSGGGGGGGGGGSGGKKMPYCDQKLLEGDDGERLVNCKINCNDDDKLFSKVFTSQNKTKYNISSGEIIKNNSDVKNVEIHNTLTVFVYLLNYTEKVDSYHFRVKHAHVNDTRFASPYCHRPTELRCQLDCPNQVIMDLATIPKSQDTVLSMPEFWQFFFLLCIFWLSQSGVWAIQDPICLDLIDKPDDFGKQRCWTSIGWGTVSMLSGWLVDYFSTDAVQKNYTPLSYLILSFMVLNLIVASNITVGEFKRSKNMFQNVLKLFGEPRVLMFLLWITLLAFYSSMSMSYLFWYIEDVASENDCGHLSWIKTLQGLSQGVQTFGGEIPIFFCSGWIIARIGHRHCMSLVLFAFAVRFVCYSVMTNPVWTLAIEALNGMTYALSRAVMVSYTRKISPPSTNHTVLGVVGLFDCVGLSLGGVLAAHVYDFYGGVWLFRIYTCCSAVTCVLMIIYNIFDSS